MSGYNEPSGGQSTDPSDTQYGSKPIRALMAFLRGVEVDTHPSYGPNYIPKPNTPFRMRSGKFYIDNPAGTFGSYFESAALASNQKINVPILENIITGLRQDEIAFLLQTQAFKKKTIQINGTDPNIIKDTSANTSHIATFDSSGNLVKGSISTMQDEVRKYQRLKAHGLVNLNAYDVVGEGHFSGIQYYGDIQAADQDSTGYWVRLQSKAAAGEFAGLAHFADINSSFRRDKLGRVVGKMQTYSGDYPLANQKFVFGLYSARALPPDSDTLITTTQHGVFIVWRSGVDTNYRILHNDGGGASALDVNSTIAYPTSSAAHEFEIRLNASDVNWYIKNAVSGGVLASGTLNSQIPGSTTKLYFYFGTIGNTKNILIRNAECDTGGH